MTWKHRPKGSPIDDPCDKPTLYMCKATHALLKKISSEKLIPVTKLIEIAVDNELNSTDPFRYVVQIPDTLYVEDDHITEAVKIYNWMIKHFKSGVDSRQLLLSRRHIGIEDSKTLLLGLRELIHKEYVISTDLIGHPSQKYYPKGHQRWMICPKKRKHHEENKRRTEDAKMQKAIEQQGPLDEA